MAVAWAEKTAKLTPPPSQLAPIGQGRPVCSMPLRRSIALGWRLAAAARGGKPCASAPGLDAPDVAGVLEDRAVGRERPHAGHVEDRFRRPGVAVAVQRVDA